MIDVYKTNPVDVKTGNYLYSHGHHNYPVAISRKRIHPHHVELGLVLEGAGEIRDLKLDRDSEILVLTPWDVPLDGFHRENMFRSHEDPIKTTWDEIVIASAEETSR